MIISAELRKLPLFALCSEESVEYFARSAADVSLASEEWVYHEGESPYFFSLLEGSVDVFKSVAGRPATLTRFSAGESFGEVPLILGSCTVTSVQAVTSVRLARVEPSVFWHLFHRDEAFRRTVSASLAQHLAGVEQLSIDAPEARCTLRGDSGSPKCHELREFLTRMHVPYVWEERAGSECEITFADGGAPLVAPGLRELAERLGLSDVPRRSHYDVAIVGAGPSGLAAAVYGASEGLDTLLIEKYVPGGQAGMSSLIENYLGFPSGISGEDLADRAFRQALRFGADVVVTREVNALGGEAGDRRLTLEGGQTVLARAVVLAPGVAYRRLEAERCEDFRNRGVYYGAAQTEAPRMSGADIHLVGGGNSAGQAALHFSPYAKSVKILIRGDDLHKDMSHYLIERIAARDNISVTTRSEVAAVAGDTRLERIAIRSNDGAATWETSHGLFVFIGASPNTRWLDGFVACDERGFIITGPQAEAIATTEWPLERPPYLLETSRPGIFAVGDARKDSIKRVASGVGEGASAIAMVNAYLQTLHVQPVASV